MQDVEEEVEEVPSLQGRHLSLPVLDVSAALAEVSSEPAAHAAQMVRPELAQNCPLGQLMMASVEECGPQEARPWLLALTKKVNK